MTENLIVDNKQNILNTIIDVPVLDDVENKQIAHLLKDGRIYATGRRKNATARLWISIGKGWYVNKKNLKDVFSEMELNKILSPLNLVESMHGELNLKIFATVKGGGFASQAGALKLALARTLSVFDPNFRSSLKQEGYLTCDSRKKEREHYGFRTSRKPQQYKRR